jgi:hypothetical protein
MCFSSEEIQSFLEGRWSLPLRRACPSLSAQAHQYVAQKPRVPTPTWVTAQYLLRWLGQAFVARAEREARQAGVPRYEYGRRSDPCWSQTVTVPQAGGYLRQQVAEAEWFLSIHIERLYRMTQTPQDEVGPDLWTQAVLGVCRHLAQCYETLRRRYKAERARAIVWDMLRRFAAWGAEEERPALPAALAGSAVAGGYRWHPAGL